ncbi:hypothetical protein HHX47_DHR4000660 [Lentinula edodes]|nr:hypothetical protein HHX47_DHR4000660 [Lentinula edodes]
MVRYEILKRGTESFQRSQPSFEKVRYESRQRKKGKAQDSKDKKENVQADVLNEPPTNKLEERIKLNQQDRSPINLIDETNKQVDNEAIGVEKSIKLNTEEVFTKYKPVDKKVNPIKATLPDEFRIERHIHGDPLLELPELSKHPKPFVPTGRYTEERKEIIDKNHPEGFLWEQERDLMHEMMCKQEAGFAWEPSEAGTFKNEFFPPVKVPVIPHEPWVERNIPIPPGIFEDVCKIIKSKIDSGIYEPSNASYRSKWFCVIKKDGKSLRLVHSLEPLNKVTIQHSGVPPATADLARSFSGRSCGGTLDLYVGYDERELDQLSRDMTTFQTPYGPHRLVKLPMGWTNSVPIFHDDVTYILRDEIPHVTIPYIDDVPVKGPSTRYELPEGGYETIPENPGIRRFVWEHFQNMNRVIQRMKYAGGTFSGTKAFLCCEETIVVGHRCTYEGSMPEEHIAQVVLEWPPCRDKTEVRAFLGTASQLRMFIANFAKKAAPLTKLTSNVPFEWNEKCDKAMDELKDGIRDCPALRPINFDWDVYLAVDTSYKAVGWYIYQIDPTEKKKFFNYFGSMTLNEREARFSQSKRELYGLKLALEASYYHVYGCRRLTVETDASYIKGMLDNPSCGPNATINRWIEHVRNYHFTLIHVKGATHGPDGLSRITPGGWQTKRPELNPEDYVDEDGGEPINFIMGDGETEEPYQFDDFKDQIDPRSGYLYETAQEADDIELDVQEALDEERSYEIRRNHMLESKDATCEVFVRNLFPTFDEEFVQNNPYPEAHRSSEGNRLDELIPLIGKYLSNPSDESLGEMSKYERIKFIRLIKKFQVDDQGRLYHRNTDQPDQPQLVVEKEKRMHMLNSAHDCLGHKGVFATNDFLQKRFWWPDIYKDVEWYVRSCKECQNRQMRLLKAPPTLMHTPSLFQKVHVDTMIMSIPSNGCKYIIHGRDSLSSWSEARAVKHENARTLGEWFFDDIICRWGCPEEVVTDNAGQMKNMLAWLEEKYGIKGIRISAYNSQANGKIERAHLDIRQALIKATGGDVSKWFYFLKMILWADRVTPRRGLGCSPYFLVTGAEPLLPFDIVESTWLVNPPNRILTRDELIGYRAQALSKHNSFIEKVRRRVDANKVAELRRFERKYRHTIKDWDFKPGQLVQVRNSGIEKSLDRKMYPRYRGPMVVIRRTKGGSYIIAEMDGTVLKEKVGAFRVLPHFTRNEPIELPNNIHELIDLTAEQLDLMVEDEDEDWMSPENDYIFDAIPHLRLSDTDSDEELSEGEDQ